MMAFVGARLEPGFELFAKLAGLRQRLRRAELVITGEGMIDDSTLMGKGSGQVAAECRKLGIPCIGVTGTNRLRRKTAGLFTTVHALTDRATLHEAMSHPSFCLANIARELAFRL